MFVLKKPTKHFFNRSDLQFTCQVFKRKNFYNEKHSKFDKLSFLAFKHEVSLVVLEEDDFEQRGQQASPIY